MAVAQSRRIHWDRLAGLRRMRRVQTVATVGLAVLGPVLALATFAVLGPLDEPTDSTTLRLVLLADFIYLLLLTGLVVARLARMAVARRNAAAGSRLHMRLVGVFAGIALIPTVLVALFAGLTVNIGLEGWFSTRVQSVVSSSLSAAEAYQDEHRRDLVSDARMLAGLLDSAAAENPLIDDGSIRALLSQGQARIQRGLREAYVIDGGGAIRARGERSYLFCYEAPAPAQFDTAAKSGLFARKGGPVAAGGLKTVIHGESQQPPPARPGPADGHVQQRQRVAAAGQGDAHRRVDVRAQPRVQPGANPRLEVRLDQAAHAARVRVWTARVFRAAGASG